MFRSLRSRVTLTAVVAVAVSAILVMFSIAIALGPVTTANSKRELHIIIDRAIALEGKVSTERLVDRISEPGFSVVVTQNGQDYIPTGNSTVIKTVDTDSNYLTESATLPKTGVTITVATLNLSSFDIFGQILSIGIPAIALVLIVLILTLRRVTRVALKPLDDMTSLAVKITDGELGQRLKVDDPNTELGRTAVAFDKMLDALESSLHRAQLAEERLRQLCADVAHELRSPLSSMVAAADNLMREMSLGGRKPAATRQLAEETAITVVRDGRRAGRIVGDLTLAAQLDVAELAEREVIKQRIDLGHLVEQCVDGFAIGAQYEVKLDNKAGQIWANADPERIAQVINNLLSNAARWTETRIELRTAVKSGKWLLTVTDDGPGVPAEYRETIFDRFVRLDADRARSKGGSGLGLAISRALAKAHDGKLECLDNVGEKTGGGGAVFRLTLPILK